MVCDDFADPEVAVADEVFAVDFAASAFAGSAFAVSALALSLSVLLPVWGTDADPAAAVFFTSFAFRSMVVGLGVNCVAPPAGVDVVLALLDWAVADCALVDCALADCVPAEGVALVSAAAAFAGFASAGLAVDAPVDFAGDSEDGLEARDRVDPVDLDFEVGRRGDFTILVSPFAHSLSGMSKLRHSQIAT